MVYSDELLPSGCSRWACILVSEALANAMTATSHSELWRVIRRTTRDARAGRLPDHYRHTAWRSPSFEARVASALAPNCKVLDIGAGRQPRIPPTERPLGCRYVGLDVSASEFAQAPPCSYDELVVADVVSRVPGLERRFDLIVSWSVFEHVKPLATAMEHLRCYLRPEGRLLAFFAGTFSAHGLINALLPGRLGLAVVSRIMHRPRETVFPAHYDRCYYRALTRMLQNWTAVEIVPAWGGAAYFRCSKLLQSVYLAYEEWARLGDHRNLATHYLVDATR